MCVFCLLTNDFLTDEDFYFCITEWKLAHICVT